MDKITIQSAEALRRYFKELSQYGYKCYGAVRKLLVLIFIQEILSSSLGDFVTEADYKVFQKVLNCLYGTSCLIPYPLYRNKQVRLHNLTKVTFRISEDAILRKTEEDILRMLNK